MYLSITYLEKVLSVMYQVGGSNSINVLRRDAFFAKPEKRKRMKLRKVWISIATRRVAPRCLDAESLNP